MDKILATAKMWAALVGAVLTAVLGTVPPHTEVWTILTAVAAICTAVVTYAVPNAPARDAKGRFE